MKQFIETGSWWISERQNIHEITRIFNESDTTGATCGGRTAYLSSATELTTNLYRAFQCYIFGFLCRIVSTIFVCLVLFCFPLYSVLLQIMASDDPFCICKLSFFTTLLITKYSICQCGNQTQNTRPWCKLGGELDLYSNWNSLPEYGDFYYCLV